MSCGAYYTTLTELKCLQVFLYKIPQVFTHDGCLGGGLTTTKHSENHHILEVERRKRSSNKGLTN